MTSVGRLPPAACRLPPVNRCAVGGAIQLFEIDVLDAFSRTLRGSPI